MTNIKNKKILIYGFGNPGRQDDGLGILLAENIEKWSLKNNLHNITTDSNYQLNLEDAAEIANYDVVIFVDASKENISDFFMESLEPSSSIEFTMHSVAPALVLYLCEKLFNQKPKAYLIHIKGYEWEFMKGLTSQAQKNLEMAEVFLKKFIMGM